MLINTLKIEKILNHQQHLHFNTPNDYYEHRHIYDMMYDAEAELKEANKKLSKFNDLWDIPIQVELGEKFPFAGYVEIDGTVHKCNSCGHEKLTRDLVYNIPEHFKRYLNVPAAFYDRKPQGMLQEEYFLMKYLGFVKVSSFENAPTKRILFRYENLTWKQSDVIYPQ